MAKGSGKLMQYVYPALGGILMVAVYFAGTWILPAMGKAAAIADLPANLIQAAFGYIGGRLLYLAYMKIEGTALMMHRILSIIKSGCSRFNYSSYLITNGDKFFGNPLIP